MSWYRSVAPFAIIVILVIFEVFCEYPRPFSNNTTTPWPALGQRRYTYQNNYPIVNASLPSWVRPNLRPIPSDYQRPSFQNTPPPWVRPDIKPSLISTNNKPSLPNQFAGNNGRNQGGSINNPKISSEPPTDDELREISETLLAQDINNAAKYVIANYQGKTTSRDTNDRAPLPLLDIKPEAYKIPSVEKVKQLYDNYILDTTKREEVTPQEQQEEENLINTVLSTPIMQYTRNFLIQKGKIGQSPEEFKNYLKTIWFNMYTRGTKKVSSSGFEHVFLAEIKNNQVSGLHNWIYFYEIEKNHQGNYLGYMKKIDLGDKGAILKYHFTFQGIDKPVGSMFIGTSPELEMALYTICFAVRADQVCPLKLNNNKFIIRTFTYTYKGQKMIGSAFPEI